MTDHPLDRPIWHALTTRQAGIAIGAGAGAGASAGAEKALRHDRDHALFAAAMDDSPAALAELGALIARTGPAILMQAGAVPPVPGTTVEKSAIGVQMVAQGLVPVAAPVTFEDLGDADAAEMLALATLTEPGPFFARTHQLGDFIGVRHEGRLVAMAGERLKLTGHTEVSGVCTHPDFRGRGLAGALTRLVAERILARGEVPLLHSYAENKAAIALYEALGFRVRSNVTVVVLRP